MCLERTVPSQKSAAVAAAAANSSADSPFDAVLAAAADFSSSDVPVASTHSATTTANTSATAANTCAATGTTANSVTTASALPIPPYHSSLATRGTSASASASVYPPTMKRIAPLGGLVAASSSSVSLASSTLPKQSLPVRKRQSRGTTATSAVVSVTASNAAGLQSIGTVVHPAATTTTTTTAALPHATTTAVAGKGDKGLRHFSQRVCSKVEEKGSTTYNEVADELVAELSREVVKCDVKNIRRRVYDALNVLMAIDVIRKDKKEIRWNGLPDETCSEIRLLEESIAASERRINEKKKTMIELVQRLSALKNLIRRNETDGDLEDELESHHHNPTSAHPHPHGRKTAVNSKSSTNSAIADRLPLPFILINAPRDCRVHCEMLEDRSQYFFEFDSPFLINEDIELLRLMSLDRTSESDLLAWLQRETVSFFLDCCESTGTGHSTSNFHSHSHSTSNFHDALNESAAYLNNQDMAEIPTFDAAAFLGLDDWGEGGVDKYLESMPPAIGSTACDIPDIHQVFSSPIKSHHSTNPPTYSYRPRASASTASATKRSTLRNRQ